MVDIKEVAENIYMIDDQLYSIPKFGSVYLLNEDKKEMKSLYEQLANNLIPMSAAAHVKYYQQRHLEAR